MERIADKYLEDKKGLYNADLYEQTGLKARPIVAKEGKTMIMNSAELARREQNRNQKALSWNEYLHLAAKI